MAPQAVLLLIIGAWLRRSIGRELEPLGRLQALQQRDSTDLTPVQVDAESRDVEHLTQTVNALMDRIHRGLRAQHEFAGNVAHELRTPLAGIRALAEYGLAQKDPAVWQAQLRSVAASQERASRLVDQLLALALADEASDSVVLQTVMIDEIVHHAVLSFLPRADAAGVDLGAVGLDRPVLAMASRELLEGLRGVCSWRHNAPVMTADLLSSLQEPPIAPLAERLRPKTIDEVIGQQHLLGPGKPLRVAFESGRLHSMILWGPPGVGKTTLARLMADAFNAQFIPISAVLGGVKDIREAVERAQTVRASGRRTVVFVDEVHRFNKAQQDAFLPHVESGLFTFIGATTENPSFEVNSALLSRATVHVLKSLADDEQRSLLGRAQGMLDAPPMTEPAVTRLIGYADGDARRLLNAYENLIANITSGGGGVKEIDEALLEKSLGEQLRRYDKGGEQFYDTISALHKAVRGSDPDAALYWFVRMLDGGVDPRYAARRMVRMASEDIGLADPRALRLALDAAETYERLGSPEGELALAQAIVYLAIAPKSNAVYSAYKAARAFIAQDGTRAVPLRLRNAPTKLMKTLDYGKGYRYAHDEEGAFAAGESYWPDDMEAPVFYEPVPRGLEIRIGERISELRRLNEKAKKSD